MHMLHLLRHAKSTWNEDAEDHDRPLSRRGRAAAKLLARHLPAAVGVLDLALCSTARRTRETLDLVLAEFRSRPKSAIEPELYLADEARLIERLQGLPEPVGSVLVVGHNPGLHELAMILAAPDSPDYPRLAGGKFPTAALASLRIEGRWSGIARGGHPLVGYLTPESLAGDEG
jgi:phosphohistidine phosphatase